MDPDPAIFVINLEDANKNQFNVFLKFLLDDRRIRIWIQEAQKIWIRRIRIRNTG